MHLVLVNCLGGLRLPRNSIFRLTDRPDMTIAVYRGRKALDSLLCTEFITARHILIDCIDFLQNRNK